MAVTVLNKDNFKNEVLKADKPVLMMAPVVEKIAEEHPEIKVCKVDIDENPELAQMFNVMSIPTLAAFKDGQLTGTAVGYQPKENVMRLFA